MKRFFFFVIAPLILAVAILYIVLTAIGAMIGVVAAVAWGTLEGFTEYFSDVLESTNDGRRTR